MLTQRLDEVLAYELILSKDLQGQSSYNILVILSLLPQNITVVAFVLENHLKVVLQQASKSVKEFYSELIPLLSSPSSTRPFYLVASDEQTLATLYKTYHLKIIKDWFMALPKVIDREHELPVDQSLLDTMQFELGVYQQAEFKPSHNFYFVELLLQHLERKVALAQNYDRQQESSIPDLLSETDYSLCFTHTFPASSQVFAEAPTLWDLLQEKLHSKGIEKLYAYQVEAIEQILAGKDTVITAPTGNGKTESFLLPLIQQVFTWKEEGMTGIKAILFYPTKALASDQLTKIHFFVKDTGIKLVQLDSDVNQADRKNIYRDASFDILITTPDLIHYSLHKKEFRDFIAATRIVVFDEIHTYTGTFGTHIYYFLRRLERVLTIGPNVQYIGVSATIANPVAFTSKLFQKEVVHIDCTTPKKNTTELFCIQRPKTTSKQDALFQVVTMLTQSRKDEKIIIFRNSQQECEKAYDKLRLIKNKRIALHRAGLTKELRVAIEKQLRNNEIDVVVTTTTLEVGIDIGGITTIITPIVPVNRLLQRIGRAGRGSRPANIFLELGHDPISFYYSTHADSYLKDISPVNITTENESVAVLHRNLLLSENSVIIEQDEQIFGKVMQNKTQKSAPELFSLRNVNEVLEVQTERGYKVTEKELPYAFYEYYPFAQLLHNSKVYKVERMEQTQKKLTAIVKPQTGSYDYKYKTRPIIAKKVFTKKHADAIDYLGPIEVKLSDCKVQLEYQGNLVNYREQVLTDSYSYDYTSKCIIWNFEDLMEEMVAEERTQGVELGSIVHTLSHVLFKAAKMIIYCGNDITNMENSIGKWKIVLVDNAINGNGMCELFYQKRYDIWERAKQLLTDCSCTTQEGCLTCTMDYGCQRRNKGLVRKLSSIDFPLEMPTSDQIEIIEKVPADVKPLPDEYDTDYAELRPIIYCPECYTLFDDFYIVKITDEQELVNPGSGQKYYCSYCELEFSI